MVLENTNIRTTQKHSPTHFIIYIVHDAPYNIPDLDVILDAVVEPQSASQSAITIKVSALPDYLPLKPIFKAYGGRRHEH
ncbi:MAG: hypothetical protein IPI79_01225 [Moraxellaceae bacterium]|nr:hypothetical protein [Moraxellaceae bacterium]